MELSDDTIIVVLTVWGITASLLNMGNRPLATLLLVLSGLFVICISKSTADNVGYKIPLGFLENYFGVYQDPNLTKDRKEVKEFRCKVWHQCGPDITRKENCE